MALFVSHGENCYKGSVHANQYLGIIMLLNDFTPSEAEAAALKMSSSLDTPLSLRDFEARPDALALSEMIGVSSVPLRHEIKPVKTFQVSNAQKQKPNIFKFCSTLPTTFQDGEFKYPDVSSPLFKMMPNASRNFRLDTMNYQSTTTPRRNDTFDSFRVRNGPAPANLVVGSPISRSYDEVFYLNKSPEVSPYYERFPAIRGQTLGSSGRSQSPDSDVDYGTSYGSNDFNQSSGNVDVENFSNIMVRESSSGKQNISRQVWIFQQRCISLSNGAFGTTTKPTVPPGLEPLPGSGDSSPIRGVEDAAGSMRRLNPASFLSPIKSTAGHSTASPGGCCEDLLARPCPLSPISAEAAEAELGHRAARVQQQLAAVSAYLSPARSMSGDNYANTSILTPIRRELALDAMPTTLETTAVAGNNSEFELEHAARVNRRGACELLSCDAS